MAIVNFHPQFVDKSRSGEKRQTVRRRWKRVPPFGETLYLYTGLRTKHAVKILESNCVGVQGFFLSGDGHVELDRIRLTRQESEAFALADGFENHSIFIGWFFDHYGLPFEGMVIYWE